MLAGLPPSCYSAHLHGSGSLAWTHCSLAGSSPSSIPLPQRPPPSFVNTPSHGTEDLKFAFETLSPACLSPRCRLLTTGYGRLPGHSLATFLNEDTSHELKSVFPQRNALLTNHHYLLYGKEKPRMQSLSLHPAFPPHPI